MPQLMGWVALDGQNGQPQPQHIAEEAPPEDEIAKAERELR